MVEGVSKILDKLKLMSEEEEVIEIANERKVSEIESFVLSLFKFRTEFQMARILKDGPWSFDNQMLLLKRWQRGMSAANVVLDRVPLWVQIWGAPFDTFSPQIATDIGGRIGTVEEVEKQRSNDSQSLFMQMRVCVFVSKPLRGGCFVSDSDELLFTPSNSLAGTSKSTSPPSFFGKIIENF
ncbi:uncharacterized protein LOC136064743 [Quercus suber]|uniref:uncharacterized protein LOC136064743 n=1 Tax=Quercus suber TaxID=58331 RepID=UPI0032DE5A57